MNKKLKNILITCLFFCNLCFGQDTTPFQQPENAEYAKKLEVKKILENICPASFSSANENFLPQQCTSEFANSLYVRSVEISKDLSSERDINGCFYLAENFISPFKDKSFTESMRIYSNKLKSCSVETTSNANNNCNQVWNAFLADLKSNRAWNLRLQDIFRENHHKMSVNVGQLFDGNLCAGKVESLFSRVDNILIERYSNMVLAEQVKVAEELSKRDESERLRKIAEENEKQRREKEVIQNQRSQEAKQKSPGSELQDKYALYMFARDCFDVRKNFKVQYINLSTFGQIKNSLKKFETEFKRKFPNIDINEKWILAEKQYSQTSLQVIEVARFSPQTFHQDLNLLCSAVAFKLNEVSNSTIQKKDF